MHVPESSNASVVTPSPATVTRATRLYAKAVTVLAVLLGVTGILVFITASFTGHAIDSMAASMPGVPRWLLASVASLAMSIAWIWMIADVRRWWEPSCGSHYRT
jgi:protein-S-isoprenylcysteine O-methyltransferase Ste14